MWYAVRSDTATMQEINAQYQARLSDLDGSKSSDETGKEHTYYYNEEREQAIINKITEVFRAGIVRDGIDFYLIGSWLWIIGETKPVKEQLGKAGLGFNWHAKRVAWYWHSGDSKGWHSKGDLSSLAAKYGATKLRSRVENEVAAA